MSGKAKIEYFHLISEHRGNRYFKIDWENETCVQVVLASGEQKGKGHGIGVYTIRFASFKDSYYWYFGKKSGFFNTTTLLGTTENQFNNALSEVLTKFKITIL